MAKLSDFDEKLSAIEQAVETTAVEVGEIDKDVTWLKEQLTHTTEGLTPAQEFEVLQRLESLGVRVGAIRDAVTAVDDRTPPRAEPEPQPDPVVPVVPPVEEPEPAPADSAFESDVQA